MFISLLHSISRLVALALLLSLSIGTASADGPAAVALAPPQQVDAFYKWYLAQIVLNEDPLTSRAPELKQYVASQLLARIYRRMNSPNGLDSDYFLQTQDYLDSWPNRIEVAPGGGTPSRPTLRVALGEKAELRRLEVSVVREAGVWKIDKVRALP